MKKKYLPLFLFLISISVFAQNNLNRPKLIVGIMVDQMRWDFLYKYSDRYSNNGFKRLLREGFSCENAFIPYVPTVTAVGHTTVYTGSIPALHGIVGNNWYDQSTGRSVYCTDDDSVQGVGSNSVAGKMSPKNLWSNTITDELRMATNFRNKTIAIALKDRGAILPGGHTANAAYWFDNAIGGWISSTFYMSTLPAWVHQFNNKKLPDHYLQQNWNTLYPIHTYKQSTPDNKSYESKLLGEDNTFPHRTDTVSRNKYETFRITPYGNSLTFEMAKAAIEGEKLGKSGFTDFLAVSFSSPDYIGHSFGPNSVEIEDTYLRLDQELGLFLNYLDAAIGKGQYLIFLTADHGVAHIPAFVEENKMPGRVMEETSLTKLLNDSLQRRFNVPNIVSTVMNYQVYFNDEVIHQNKQSKKELAGFVVEKLMQVKGISRAFALEETYTTTLPHKIQKMVANGYNPNRSGDVQFIMFPQWFSGSKTGTTHGVWNPYDSHIPMVWYGWGIKAGKSNREVYMNDIAPTLAALLRIQMPNAATGEVIEEVMK